MQKKVNETLKTITAFNIYTYSITDLHVFINLLNPEKQVRSECNNVYLIGYQQTAELSQHRCCNASIPFMGL